MVFNADPTLYEADKYGYEMYEVEDENPSWEDVEGIYRGGEPLSRAQLVQTVLQAEMTWNTFYMMKDELFDQCFEPTATAFLTLYAQVGINAQSDDDWQHTSIRALPEQYQWYAQTLERQLQDTILTLDPKQLCRLAMWVGSFDERAPLNVEPIPGTMLNTIDPDFQPAPEWRIQLTNGAVWVAHESIFYELASTRYRRKFYVDYQHVDLDQVSADYSEQGWLNMRLPSELIQVRKLEGESGKQLTMLNITLPSPTLIGDTDYAGWQISVPATRRALDAIEAKEPTISIGVRPGWQINAYNRTTHAKEKLQPDALAEALAYAEQNRQHMQAFERVANSSRQAADGHWNILRGAEPDLTYRITPQAQRIVAVFARDLHVISQLKAMANQFAVEYLNGVYQPQAALTRVHDFVKQYTASNAAMFGTLTSDDQLYAAHTVLGAMTDPINGQILHHIEQGSSSSPRIVAQYRHDLDAQIGEFIDEGQTHYQPHTSFHPYQKLSVEEALNMASWGVTLDDYPGLKTNTNTVQTPVVAAVTQLQVQQARI